MYLASTNTLFRTGRRTGFSLVELSIVLVILGLLTGGILAGQSLIRATELRSISIEYGRWITATQTFRDKYFALPGDMTNAQSFWGVAHATPATCKTTVSTTMLTCNGNGDSRINDSAGSVEPARYWQHLANAGLIEGTYQGTASPPAATTSLNSPRGKISNALWHISFTNDYTGGVPGAFDGLFDLVYNNSFRYGASSGSYPQKILKSEEAWNIDTKIDDGKPAQGTLVAYTANMFYGDTCTDAPGGNPGSATLTANYALNTNAIYCGLVFRNQF